jgi:hypothetical protein
MMFALKDSMQMKEISGFITWCTWWLRGVLFVEENTSKNYFPSPPWSAPSFTDPLWPDVLILITK